MEAMLRTRPDWCLSRQRRWGVPIALFAHRQTGEPHPKSLDFIEIIAEKVEREGIEAWFTFDPIELLQEDAKDYEKINDVLDVWFDSGVTHACVLKKRPELAFPADMYLEGSDQHRGWFQSSLLASVAISEEAPYKSLLTHGFVVDAEGHKMSKSKGNIRSPQEIMNTLGADILRLWVAGGDYSGEIAFSEEILQRIVDAYRRTRNTMRFLLGNLFDFDPQNDLLAVDDCLDLDRYAILLAKDFMQDVQRHYENYEFHPVVQAIHRFCAEELGGFYLDILKDRLYTTKADSRARRSAQSSLYWMTRTLLCAMAPILSYTAEEAFSHFDRQKESLFLETWPSLPWPGDEEVLRHYFENLSAVRAEVNKAIEKTRAQGQIGSSLEAEITCYAKPALLAILEKIGPELKFFFITSKVTVRQAEEKTPEALLTSIDGLFLSVNKATDPKCNRCWHHHSSVGTHIDHPQLCSRCLDNLYGQGEERHHV
jgi:isoleucyl-tRNA synthetase